MLAYLPLIDAAILDGALGAPPENLERLFGRAVNLGGVTLDGGRRSARNLSTRSLFESLDELQDAVLFPVPKLTVINPASGSVQSFFTAATCPSAKSTT